jgi:hypothetical protein
MELALKKLIPEEALAYLDDVIYITVHAVMQRNFYF